VGRCRAGECANVVVALCIRVHSKLQQHFFASTIPANLLENDISSRKAPLRLNRIRDVVLSILTNPEDPNQILALMKADCGLNRIVNSARSPIRVNTKRDAPRD
jgi:hypothetical protein